MTSSNNDNSFSLEKKCQICYYVYNNENQQHWSSAYAQKLLDCCTQHLFSELIDGTFQWSSNSSEYLPFCTDCSASIQQISMWNDQIETLQREISDFVDRFTLKVLKCRKDLKNTGSRNTLRDAPNSNPSLKIVDVTSNIFDHQNHNLFQYNQPVPAEAHNEDNDNDCVELKYVPAVPPIISSYAAGLNPLNNSAHSTPSVGESVQICSPVSNQSTSGSTLSISGIQKLEIKLERLEFDDTGLLISKPPKSSISAAAWPKNTVRMPQLPIPFVDLEDESDQESIIAVDESADDVEGDEEATHPSQMRDTVGKRQKTKTSPNKRTRRKKFKCTSCIKSFSYKRSWEKHIAECSGEIVKYACVQCKITFSTQAELDDHIAHKEVLNVSQASEPIAHLFPCDVCNKSYLSEKRLLWHKSSHAAERPFKCNQCSSTFIGKNHLTMHLRKHSNDKKKKRLLKSKVSKASLKYVKPKPISFTKNGRFKHKFSCKFCGKTFLSKQKLISHMQTHTETSVYRCSTCDRVFSSKTVLKTHQIVHTGEKKMKCAVCNLSFKYYYELKRHIVVHTVESESNSIDISPNVASDTESQPASPTEMNVNVADECANNTSED